MSLEEKKKMLEGTLKQAEVREEECRLNYLIAQSQVQLLKKEHDHACNAGTGSEPKTGK